MTTQSPTNPALAMIAVLGLIATISGTLLVTTYQLTLPAISENQRIMTEQAVLQVLPDAARIKNLALAADNSLKEGHDAEGLRFFAGYGADGRFKGIAAEGHAQGYAGMVSLLYAFRPDCQCITAFHIVKMSETPGLGDKILTNPDFLENFKALGARAGAEGLLNPIVTVKHGSKTQSWQIDAISGATITSRAVGKAINDSAQTLLPRLAARIEELQK